VSDGLPQILDPNGQLVRLVTAEHLLAAAGITDPTQVELEDLAQFVGNADHLVSISREAKGTVSDELVRRLDRKAKGTLHEGAYKIVVPSKQAGTDAFDTEKLKAALEALHGAGLIDEDAWCAALEWVEPEPYLKQKLPGIKALLKQGGEVEAAIEAARVETTPPKRTAKVTRKTAA
jgi:hypothetical protein